MIIADSVTYIVAHDCKFVFDFDNLLDTEIINAISYFPSMLILFYRIAINIPIAVLNKYIILRRVYIAATN